jgi:hypothetical protein
MLQTKYSHHSWNHLWGSLNLGVDIKLHKCAQLLFSWSKTLSWLRSLFYCQDILLCLRYLALLKQEKLISTDLYSYFLLLLFNCEGHICRTGRNPVCKHSWKRTKACKLPELSSKSKADINDEDREWCKNFVKLSYLASSLKPRHGPMTIS